MLFQRAEILNSFTYKVLAFGCRCSGFGKILLKYLVTKTNLLFGLKCVQLLASFTNTKYFLLVILMAYNDRKSHTRKRFHFSFYNFDGQLFLSLPIYFKIIWEHVLYWIKQQKYYKNIFKCFNTFCILYING